jgi:hypothetical protein
MIDSTINLHVHDFELKENLLFIDSTIDDYQTLINLAAPDTEIFLLNSSQNGIEQISERLAQYHNLESVQIISHGQAGGIQLGDAQLNLDTSSLYADQIQNWGNALKDKGDILFYGCNVAANQDGKNLINELKDLTGWLPDTNI